MSQEKPISAPVTLEKDKEFHSYSVSINPNLFEAQFKVKKHNLGLRCKIDLTGIDNDTRVRWGIRYFLAHIFAQAMRSQPASEVRGHFGKTLKAIDYVGKGKKGRIPLSPEAQIAKTLSNIKDLAARDAFIKATWRKGLPKNIKTLLDEYLKTEEKPKDNK